jgi:hypothetical protein
MEPTRRRGHSIIDEESEDKMQDQSGGKDGGNGEGPPAFDPNFKFEDDNEEGEHEQEDFDESNEEEYFSRTRSRSRSVHENDDPKVKSLTQDEIIRMQVEKSKNHVTERVIEPKTGPLQQREVVALQRVCS